MTHQTAAAMIRACAGESSEEKEETPPERAYDRDTLLRRYLTHVGSCWPAAGTARLAWSLASPTAIDVVHIWPALICVDLGFRDFLASVFDDEVAHELHLESIVAVFGDRMAQTLERLGLRHNRTHVRC